MVNPTGYTALDLVGYTDRGAYAGNVAYVKNDLVHYSGNIWRCLIDDTTNIAPVEGVNWTLFIGEPSNMVEAIIAPIEVSPSENAYVKGEQLIFNDTLYKTTAAIAIGDSLTVGTNIEVSPKIVTQMLDKVEWSSYSNLGCVNLCPNNASTTTTNGVTFTVNADGTVTASAASYPYTLASTASLKIWEPSTASDVSAVLGKSVKLTGCPAGGDATSTYNILAYRTTSTDGSSGGGSDIGSGYTFTWKNNCSGTKPYIALRVMSGYTMTEDLTFKPMITVPDYSGSYVPYNKTNKELTDFMKGWEVSDYTNTAPTPSTNSITIGSFAADRRGYIVQLNFSVTASANISTATDLFTIPDGWRPARFFNLNASPRTIMPSTYNAARFSISGSGVVQGRYLENGGVYEIMATYYAK